MYRAMQEKIPYKEASGMSGYVSHISVNNYSIRVVSRVNYFQKQVGAKKLEAPKWGHKIFKIMK